QAERVTELILDEMDREARSHGARFAVVFLMGAPDRLSHYREYLTGRGIPLIDCDRRLLPAMVVRGEGHPNRLMHEQWADCMAAALRREWQEQVPRNVRSWGKPASRRDTLTRKAVVGLLE